MSFRYGSGIVKPGFNPLGAQTSTYLYNLFSWGTSDDGGGSFSGALGLGNLTAYSSPKQVGSAYWSKVSIGHQHAAAIKSDGTLWNWGYQAGQGSGVYASSSSPTQVGSLTTWASVTAGRLISFGIKTDGTLWVWGSGTGYFGENGLGNLTAYSSPKQVGALTNWLSVSCGNYHVAAVKTDGTLWTWGGMNYGELGNGNDGTNLSSPGQVGTLTNWASTACGAFHCLAVKTDGTLWSWGMGNQGQQGRNQSNSSTNSPNQIGALTTWSNTFANTGGNFSFAIKTDGTLWSWGNNANGKLGLGDTNNRSSPVQIGALNTWSSGFATLTSGGAIKTDGTLWTWGKNNYGQLGLGNTTYYSSPKLVGNTTTWLRAAGGQYATLALG